MALTAALLGWMFDGLEMGLFPLVARPALQDLLGRTGDEGAVGLWFGVMTAGFLVGAATGGVLFGWLGDRIGRVRAMTLSVLTYTLFTGLCGLAPSLEWFFLFRFLASLGMGGEWSLGVALVMEIWPNTSRGLLAGLIGAAANVGFLLIAVISLGLSGILGSLTTAMQSSPLPASWVAALVANNAWRLLLMIGALPALLDVLHPPVRAGVGAVAARSRSAAARRTGRRRDLLGVLIGACGPLVTIYLWAWPATTIGGTTFAHSLAAARARDWCLAWPWRSSATSIRCAAIWAASARPAAKRPQSKTVVGRMIVGACLSGVALLGTWASMQMAPSWADRAGQQQIPKQASQILSGNIWRTPRHTRKSAMGDRRDRGHDRRGRRGRLVQPPLDVLSRSALASLGSVAAVLAIQYGLRLHVSGHGAARGRRDGLVLRLASALSAGAVPHDRAGDRPGLWLQLRPHPGGDRRVADGQPDERSRSSGNYVRWPARR